MKTAKLSKFKWHEISERNSGHTENEWRFQKKKSISNFYIETQLFILQVRIKITQFTSFPENAEFNIEDWI